MVSAEHKHWRNKFLRTRNNESVVWQKYLSETQNEPLVNNMKPGT